MANTSGASGKTPMSDDERADLKAMIAAGRELDPDMDESLVESYAQRRASEQQARAKVQGQGKEIVAQQPQQGGPLAGVNPAVAITGIVAMAAVFIVIGSLLVSVVVIYHFVARERAARMLDSWKVWLLANNGTLTAVLLVVVGVLLVGKGISGLNLFG